MSREIIQTRFFNHNPETVWRMLTEPELIEQWLMENDFKPVKGHKFQFKAKPKVKLGFDGNIYCEVLEIEPYKKLAYSWKGGPRKGKITLDSIVEWTLIEKNNGTELILKHSGFKGVKNYIPYLVMSKGWKLIIHKRFEKILNNVKS